MIPKVPINSHRCRFICGSQSLQSGGANEFLTTELQAGSKCAFDLPMLSFYNDYIPVAGYVMSAFVRRTEWLRKDLHVVLVNPQIPQNTGEQDIAHLSHAYWPSGIPRGFKSGKHQLGV